MKTHTSTLPLWRAMIALGVMALALAAGVVGVREARATLDVPQILVYQGRLTDDDRITVADGSYSMVFSLYTASSGGTPVWTAAGTVGTPTAISVTVTDGIFTYNLGSGANLFDDELFEDNSTLYLGVTIGSDSEMTPRRQLGSAAYAMHAGDSDLLDDLNTDSDGCTTACIPVTSSAGNLVITGDPQATTISGGSVYINPASADADEMLFGVALGGNARFSVDEDGDVDMENHVAIGAGASISTLNALTIAQDYGAGDSHSLIDVSSTFDDAGNAGTTLRGANVSLTVDAGAGNGVEGLIGYQAALNHDGSGVTDAASGANLSVTSSAGTVTTASGVTVNVLTDNVAATVTTGRGIQANVTNSAGTMTTGYGGDFYTTGTMTTSYGIYSNADATATNNYGVFAQANNGTNDYAIYTSAGRVHIEGDDTATTPDIATADGDLFVLGDIESDADLLIGDHASVGSAGSIDTTNTLNVMEDFTAPGAIKRLTSMVSYYDGAGNPGTIGVGDRVNLVVDAGAGNDVQSLTAFRGELDHDGSGTTDALFGIDTDVVGSAGKVSAAYGAYLDVTTDNAAASFVEGYGVYAYTGASSTGTITTGYGGYFGSDNAGTNYAIYTAEGRVHIEGDATATTPDAATGDGTLYVKGLTEIDDTLYVDKVSTSTSAGTEYGLSIDATDTGNVTTDTDATYGIDVTTTRTGATGGTFRSYGVRAQAIGDGAGDSVAYGVYAHATGADTNFGLYVDGGAFHVEGDGTATTPTFTGVGVSGTGFFTDNVEIYDGSLCVGDGVTDDCNDAAGTDGVIYSIAASVTQHDLAEMFPSNQLLLAGEIISVDPSASEKVVRTTGSAVIVGAVSTNPGFVLGWGRANEYAVALTGRTPIKVNGEGGPIAIGDRITISSVPGIGRKATEVGEVVGVAMEAFDGSGSGAIMSFILPQWWDGVAVAPSVTEQEPEPSVQADRVLVMEDGFIRNIMGLQGGGWSVDYDGAFVTEGSYGVLIRGNGGHDVATYSTLSTQQMVILSGTTKMPGAMAEVKFEDVGPLFNDVIAVDAPMVVTATMSNGSGTVSIRRKDTNGFELWREGGTGDEVDWIAMAYRKDKAPVEDVEEEPKEEEEEENMENETGENVGTGRDLSEGESVIEEPVDEGDAALQPEGSENEDIGALHATPEQEIEKPVAGEPVIEESIEEPVAEDPIGEVADDEVIEEPVEEEGAEEPVEELVQDEGAGHAQPVPEVEDLIDETVNEEAVEGEESVEEGELKDE